MELEIRKQKTTPHVYDNLRQIAAIAIANKTKQGHRTGTYRRHTRLHVPEDWEWNLDLAILGLKPKLKAAEKQVSKERGKVKACSSTVRRFKVYPNESVQFIQRPELLKQQKQLVMRRLWRLTSSTNMKRQRDYLERTPLSPASKDQGKYRADNVRIMQANVPLIKEINKLRRDLRGSEDRTEAKCTLREKSDLRSPPVQQKSSRQKFLETSNGPLRILNGTNISHQYDEVSDFKDPINKMKIWSTGVWAIACTKALLQMLEGQVRGSFYEI
ncbi:hypothetical protein BJ742DRAFT_736416 [Cladochytrium replicatum]|nr:hypothetical protein BJ742DRAFT_736416 [Cladochytrium replicatum]